MGWTQAGFRYGIREVYYGAVYHESHAPEIADLYGVSLKRVE